MLGGAAKRPHRKSQDRNVLASNAIVMNADILDKISFSGAPTDEVAQVVDDDDAVNWLMRFILIASPPQTSTFNMQTVSSVMSRNLALPNKETELR
jgi:hypothetical protein